MLPAILLLCSFVSCSAPADSIVRARLHSGILNQNRELIIHLPRNYDPSLKYPVMYVLDGSSQDQHIADKFDSLKIPAIIVGIPNMSAENRQFQLVPPFMRIDPDNPESALGKGELFLQFMESELIPYMEKSYGVSPVRLFAGHSRGGLLVLYSLLVKPELFEARFCFSAPVWRQDKLLVGKLDEFLTAHPAVKTFLYMSVGGNETGNMKSGLDGMKQVLTQKAAAGFVWHADYIPGAVHQNNAQASAGIGISKWAGGSRMQR